MGTLAWWRDVGVVVVCILLVTAAGFACFELFGWDRDGISGLVVPGLSAMTGAAVWEHRKAKRTSGSPG